MSLGSTTAKNVDIAGSYGDNKGATAPSTLTFRLYVGNPTSTGVEVSGGSYAGVAIANTTANMGTPSGGSLGSINVGFPTATGSWGTPDHWACTDGSGHLFDTGAISSPQAIGAGQTATLSVTITAS